MYLQFHHPLPCEEVPPVVLGDLLQFRLGLAGLQDQQEEERQDGRAGGARHGRGSSGDTVQCRPGPLVSA